MTAATHERPRDEAVAPPSNASFGFTVGGILVVWAVGAASWTGEVAPIHLVLAGVGAALAIAAWARPSTLGGANRMWNALGILLGRIVAPLVMGIVFFLAVVPTALVMRALGHDPLRLRAAASKESYWHRRDPAKGDTGWGDKAGAHRGMHHQF